MIVERKLASHGKKLREKVLKRKRKKMIEQNDIAISECAGFDRKELREEFQEPRSQERLGINGEEWPFDVSWSDFL